MRESNSYFILHVSDFHISEKTQKNASLALAVLIDKLKEMDISISYLIHTGDVINSSDIKARIKKENTEPRKENTIPSPKAFIASPFLAIG